VRQLWLEGQQLDAIRLDARQPDECVNGMSDF
jgi:hypothetical protein